MKKGLLFLFAAAALALAACGTKATPAPTALFAPSPVPATQTPDPCSQANLPDEVKKVHALMREFDDYSTLASNVPQAQLLQIIPDLQRVLRSAEDQTVPPCLQKLKELQLAHMGLVVQTLVLFMNAQDNSTVEQINAGITQARDVHLQYDAERAKLLGVTLQPTSTAPVAETAAAPVVKNIGSKPINLRAAPNADAATLATLPPEALAVAVGKTANSEWIQIQIPDGGGKTAWVYAQLVTLSVPVSQLPVVSQ